MHRHTPTLAVIDPRSAVVREIAYHRRSSTDIPQARITQHLYDTINRVSHSRDPRFFALSEGGVSTPANQTTVTSLTGVALLSVNVDAGWRLRLCGGAGQRLEDWDQKLNHLRIAYDSLMRPESGFESSAGEERRTACFSYADTSLESARHNRCGRLIRHDDTAGTRHLREYSLLGAHQELARCFLENLVSPDWPEREAERDELLEPQTAMTRMSYNSVGELIRHVDAVGNEQIQRQTVAGELYETRMNLAGANEEITLVGQIRYNAFGQIEQQTAGNGVVTLFTSDPENGWLKSLRTQVAGAPPLQNLAYDYDPVGNPVRINDDAQSIRYFSNQRVAAINTYKYDTLGQLIEASGRQRVHAPGGPHLPEFVSPPDSNQLENYLQTFAYDAGGNLETLDHHADSGNRTERTAIATLSNRSLPWIKDSEPPVDGEIDAGYDANGNLKALQRGQTLQWDTRDRLRQIVQVIRRDGPDDVESYVYDGEGLRVRKIRMIYTGTSNRTHETRYLPGVEIHTTPDETLHVISVQAGQCTVRILHWKKGQPRGIPQNQLRYCFADHLGSNTLELDKDVTLISQESYYPYGATAWWAGREMIEAGYKTIRYSGQERDATGLYYYGLRYYMPWRQRWLNADPAGVADGLNLFRMVGGNPIGYVDLFGLGKTREITKAQRIKATLSGVGRGTVRAAAGYGAKQLAKKALGRMASYPLALMSGMAAAYAGGRAAARILDSHGQTGTRRNLTVAGVGIIGFGVGFAVGFATPDPVGVTHGVVKTMGSIAAGRMISGIGPSISPDIDSRRALAVNTMANLGGNIAKGMLSGITPASVHPILNSATGAAIKEGVSSMIRFAGGVDSRFKDSTHSEMRLPTGRDLIEAGKTLAQDTASAMVYKLGNAEIDQGLTAVLGSEEVESTLRRGLRQMKLANEMGAIGKHIYKEQDDGQADTPHKATLNTMMPV